MTFIWEKNHILASMPSKKFNGRRHEIYFPSPKDLERWKIDADNYHISLSKWIYQMVENGLAQRQEPDKANLFVDDISIASGRE